MHNDSQLIDAVLRGEPGADEAWVENYRRLIIGLARSRYGLSPEDAEDVLQATVAAVWADDRRALRAWRRQGRFSTYLTVIVCRLVRERLGHEKRRRRHETTGADVPGPGLEPVDGAPSPVDRATRDERWRLVNGALAEMKPRDRLLIALRFFDDRQPHEMAPLLGLTHGAARKAVHDAVARLRRRMAGPGPRPEGAANDGKLGSSDGT